MFLIRLLITWNWWSELPSKAHFKGLIFSPSVTIPLFSLLVFMIFSATSNPYHVSTVLGSIGQRVHDGYTQFLLLFFLSLLKNAYYAYYNIPFNSITIVIFAFHSLNNNWLLISQVNIWFRVHSKVAFIYKIYILVCISSFLISKYTLLLIYLFNLHLVLILCNLFKLWCTSRSCWSLC